MRNEPTLSTTSPWPWSRTKSANRATSSTTWPSPSMTGWSSCSRIRAELVCFVCDMDRDLLTTPHGRADPGARSGHPDPGGHVDDRAVQAGGVVRAGPDDRVRLLLGGEPAPRHPGLRQRLRIVDLA